MCSSTTALSKFQVTESAAKEFFTSMTNKMPDKLRLEFKSSIALKTIVVFIPFNAKVLFSDVAKQTMSTGKTLMTVVTRRNTAP